MRLNNYISATGLCSRREADQYIIDRRVTVNGELAELGMQIGEEDQVSLDGNLLTPKSEFVTIAYHKPVGIICTSETGVEDWGCSMVGLLQTRSMMSAMPCPTPMHMVHSA